MASSFPVSMVRFAVPQDGRGLASASAAHDKQHEICYEPGLKAFRLKDRQTSKVFYVPAERAMFWEMKPE